MDRITGKIVVELSLDEAHYLNILMDRDEPRQANINRYQLVSCPTCGKYISKSASFCEYCGQRIDPQDYAIGGEDE